MSENLVAKFGGTSMARPELVAEIISARPDQSIVVASAPGKLPGDVGKMTDVLGLYSDLPIDDPLKIETYEHIMDRFTELFRDLPKPDAAQLSNELCEGLQNRAGDRKYIVSRGEHFSARGLAIRLGARFVESAGFRFNAVGEFDRVASLPQLASLGALSQEGRLVVPGYYGFGPDESVALFDRGGSDRTGAILAAVMGWNYENWTDKPGVLSADDRFVPGARPIPVLSREEVREGAHGGTGVLQGDTIIDLAGSSSIVTVKNTFDPEAPGTEIVPRREAEVGHSIVAFSGRDDLWEVSIRDFGMAGRYGYAAELFDRFSQLGLSLEYVPGAQDAFSLTTTVSDDEQRAALDTFVSFARGHRLSSHGEVELSQRGVVCAIGEGLRDARKRMLADIRLQGDILNAGHTVIEGSLSHSQSPSLAYLVEPSAVKPIIQAMHKREIEKVTGLI